MTHKTFASAPIDETRLHVLPFKAPPVRPDTRHDQLVNLAAGENDAAETARADVWLNCPDMPMASRDKERIEVFLAGGIKAELFVKGRAVRTTPSGPASGGSYSFAQTGPVPEVAWSMLQQIFWIEAGGKKTAGRLEGNALGHQLEDICAHACRGDADAVETATAVAWSALGISLPTNSNFTPARA